MSRALKGLFQFVIGLHRSSTAFVEPSVYRGCFRSLPNESRFSCGETSEVIHFPVMFGCAILPVDINFSAPTEFSKKAPENNARENQRKSEKNIFFALKFIKRSDYNVKGKIH